MDKISSDPIGFAEIILLFLVDLVHYIIGILFLKQFWNKSLIDSQRKIHFGYGLWFFSIGAGHMVYSLDRYWRFFYDFRLFKTYDRIINRDYMLVSFIFLEISFLILTFLIEKYLFNRKKVILPYLCGLSIIMTVFLRPIETLTYDEANPPGIVSDLLGFMIYGIFGIVFILIIFLYLRLASLSPSGSVIKRKSIIAVVGIILWTFMIIAGNNIFSKAEWFVGVNLVGPILTIIMLFTLKYAFSKI
ncbi:MAG: hypothetical protein ACTSRZ_14025 [Promethearchaeota archaeon]